MNTLYSSKSNLLAISDQSNETLAIQTKNSLFSLSTDTHKQSRSNYMWPLHRNSSKPNKVNLFTKSNFDPTFLFGRIIEMPLDYFLSTQALTDYSQMHNLQYFSGWHEVGTLAGSGEVRAARRAALPCTAYSHHRERNIPHLKTIHTQGRHFQFRLITTIISPYWAS